MFRAPVRGGAFLSSFRQDDEGAASGQQLHVLREGFAKRGGCLPASTLSCEGQRLKVLRDGFAEHGESWLRAELEKHNVKELHGVAAAAGVVQAAYRWFVRQRMPNELRSILMEREHVYCLTRTVPTLALQILQLRTFQLPAAPADHVEVADTLLYTQSELRAHTGGRGLKQQLNRHQKINRHQKN